MSSGETSERPRLGGVAAPSRQSSSSSAATSYLEPPAILEARGVHRVYRAAGRQLHALRGVDLALPRGWTTALVGESGSGKSTLARLLVCLERPDRGEIVLDGVEVGAASGRARQALRRRVQMVFQDPSASLNPRMRVRSIVGEPLAVHRLCSRRERPGRVLELLSQVGLAADALTRFPHEFSGGQRQRISLARALAVSPEIIVADEPVSALDVSVRAQVLNLMMDLQQTHGLTYLLVAHDLALVRHVAQKVAVMYLGTLVEQGCSEAVLERPLHPYTRALLAAVPRPDPKGRGQRAEPLAGETPSPFELPRGCPFHPRCPEALAVCSRETPALRGVAEDQAVACHLPRTRRR